MSELQMIILKPCDMKIKTVEFNNSLLDSVLYFKEDLQESNESFDNKPFISHWNFNIIAYGP